MVAAKARANYPTNNEGKVQEPQYVRIVDAAGNDVSPASGGSQIQGSEAHDAVAASNPVPIGAYASSFPSGLATVADADRVRVTANPHGQIYVAAGDYGGDSGADGRPLYGFSSRSGAGVTPVPTAVGDFDHNGASWDRTRKPNSTSRLLSAAASTNATSVKASAGDLVKATGYCARATPVFLKLYNKASAPTVGTDVPVQTYRLDPTAKFDLTFERYYFSTGIAYALTTAAADADTGALTAADVVTMDLLYA